MCVCERESVNTTTQQSSLGNVSNQQYQVSFIHIASLRLVLQTVVIWSGSSGSCSSSESCHNPTTVQNCLQNHEDIWLRFSDVVGCGWLCSRRFPNATAKWIGLGKLESPCSLPLVPVRLVSGEKRETQGFQNPEGESAQMIRAKNPLTTYSVLCSWTLDLNNEEELRRAACHANATFSSDALRGHCRRRRLSVIIPHRLMQPLHI